MIKSIFLLPLLITILTAQAGQHRSHQAKAEFKRSNPCPSNGATKGRCEGYIIDHITAIKRGGSDTPDNMQWQTVEDAKMKDRWE